MQEVAARGGKLILVTDPKGCAAAAIDAVETLILPESSVKNAAGTADK
jgi:glucosamine--fructose-6-phosphate aminotransferase (isomerizing)